MSYYWGETKYKSRSASHLSAELVAVNYSILAVCNLKAGELSTFSFWEVS